MHILWYNFSQQTQQVRWNCSIGQAYTASPESVGWRTLDKLNIQLRPGSNSTTSISVSVSTFGEVSHAWTQYKPGPSHSAGHQYSDQKIQTHGPDHQGSDRDQSYIQTTWNSEECSPWASHGSQSFAPWRNECRLLPRTYALPLGPPLPMVLTCAFFETVLFSASLSPFFLSPIPYATASF
jgi:hypothetical protein